MQIVLGLIALYGETGMPMMSGDSIWCRCHPILAIFVGDYSEQTLMMCTHYNQCPKCQVLCEHLGEYQTFLPRKQSLVIDSYLSVDADMHTFYLACHEAGLKAIYHLFWESLPHIDIFLSITPDILHQLLQGIVKHLIIWLVGIFRPAAINAQC